MKNRASFYIIWVIVGLLFLCNGVASAQTCDAYKQRPRIVRVGFVTDGSTPGDRALVELFKKEIKAMFEPEFKVRFSDKWTLSGKDTLDGVRAALNKLLSMPGPEVILALGIISSTEVLNRKYLPKPVIAPYVANFALKGKGKKGKASGIKNLVYVDSIYYLDRDIETFKKFVPLKRVGLILDRREMESIPNIYQLARLFGERHGIKVSLIPAWDSVDDVLSEIPDNVDAVLVGPLWHFTDSQKERFAKGLIRKKIPGFAIWDSRQVELGLLAGMERTNKMDVLARRTAVALMDIVQGQLPQNVDVEFVRERELTVNMATARELQIYPSVLVLTDARLINEERKDVERRLNIKKAVDEAIAANLQLLSAKIGVEAGKHSVKEAVADLLPRIDLQTGLQAVDNDRAKASGGMSPERVWTGSAGGSVLIYSEKKWANYTAEGHLQRAREMQKEKVKLDVTYDAAVAYLNVLRSRTIERIYKENLALTKANLERAQIRVNTGAAGPDEVYRWQSKYANDRRQVLYRESDTMDAMEALNRILHRPLDEVFVPEETKLEDPLFIMGDKFFFKLMENPLLLQKFKGFATKEAVEVRPELKIYDAAIDAKKRLKTAAKRELWLPDFTVEWGVDQYFAEDGDGQREGTPLDDTDWTIGVFARIPLFEGGKTYQKAGRLEKEVYQLYTDRDSVAEKITQQVFAAINRTRASYPSIRLTREAEEAARKNLDLVTDMYIQGIKTIIDLLDAQNQYLSARLDSANAVYNFLIDFMGVQRAIGEFVIFMPEEARKEWINRASAEIGRPERVSR